MNRAVLWLINSVSPKLEKKNSGHVVRFTLFASLCLMLIFFNTSYHYVNTRSNLCRCAISILTNDLQIQLWWFNWLVLRYWRRNTWSSSNRKDTRLSQMRLLYQKTIQQRYSSLLECTPSYLIFWVNHIQVVRGLSMSRSVSEPVILMR